jgi:hypothetical protein
LFGHGMIPVCSVRGTDQIEVTFPVFAQTII